MAGDSRASQPGNLLPYADQAMFLALRGAGQDSVMQFLWIYDHPVDFGALKRFQDNFSQGWMARLIEPSPVPFGRHRWVTVPPGAVAAQLDIAARPRPREEFADWADEHVQLPLDPQWGPAWRLGVQPMTDGSTAVSLVISHCIADGRAAIDSVVDAVNGKIVRLDYPLPGSRTRSQAVRADLRQTVRDAREIGRTLRKAVKALAGRRRDTGGSAAGTAPTKALVRQSATARHITLPVVSFLVDVDQWDARAEALGGNGLSLVAGFTGRLAERLGRVRASDGKVTLMIPVSERDDISVDTGGNMVAIARVSIDPAPLTNDLSGARSAIREAVRTARDTPDEMVELLPLIPFLPKRAVTAMADMAFGFSADLPVSCSNMGEVPMALRYLDGTAAEYVSFRGVDRDLTPELIERRSGVLTLISGRVEGTVTTTVISYQLEAENTRGALHELVAQTLHDFNLTGTIV